MSACGCLACCGHCMGTPWGTVVSTSVALVVGSCTEFCALAAWFGAFIDVGGLGHPDISAHCFGVSASCLDTWIWDIFCCGDGGVVVLGGGSLTTSQKDESFLTGGLRHSDLYVCFFGYLTSFEPGFLVSLAFYLCVQLKTAVPLF